MARVTKADANRAEQGFKWAIKKADLWAPTPLWKALSIEASNINRAWWATVPKAQLVQCVKSSSCWSKGDVLIARKTESPGWYLIVGYTDDGRDFVFSAVESN